MTYIEDIRKELLEILEGTAIDMTFSDCFRGRSSKTKPIRVKRQVAQQFVRARRILRTIGENSHKYLSDKFLESILLDLITDLKYTQKNELKGIIDAKISEIFKRIRKAELKMFTFLIPIMHLQIHEQFEIGDTKFIRLNKDTLQTISSQFEANVLLSTDNLEAEATNLNDTNETSSYALVSIDASDDEKAVEIAYQKTDFSLNIIRLFNKQSPISLRSEYAKEIPTWILMIPQGSKSASHCMASHNFSIADDITKEKIENMKKLGLDIINSLVTLKFELEPIQQDILTAIFWFGNAVKDTDMVTKFLKCIIVLETLLIQGEQNKSIALSKKLSSSLYAKSNDKDKKQIFKSMFDLYGLRNSITHSGLNRVVTEDVDSVILWSQSLILLLLKYVTTHKRMEDLFQSEFVINDSLYQQI